MHGEAALAPGFTHFPYANPQAPQGGRLVLGVQGTFDTLNPYPVKGVTAAPSIANFVFEPLMRRSLDEPFTLYPLIAEGFDMPGDRSAITFRLDERARFSDGRPVTAQDVAFTFDLLKTKGRPNYRNSFAKVAKTEILGERLIRFDLSGANDRELPLILGLMPVLPRHAVNPETFENSSFAPPLGSGPYRVAEVKPGESLLYRKNPDYWGQDLPVNRGIYNFDEVRYDYYRDANSLFEGFKAGLYDWRIETDPTRWLTGYDIPAVQDGRILRQSVENRLPKGMTGFVFNTRRALLNEPLVREALSYALDFEWINEHLFGRVYQRTGSYFEGSDLSAKGVPASEAEQRLLAPFPGAVREDIMKGAWRPPVSDGSGRDRVPAQKALELLRQAGFSLAGESTLSRNGEALSFEILVVSRDQERIALNFAKNLGRIGVAARVRLVDGVQYERRRQRFEFDVMIASWPVSSSPGNEQFFRWGSLSADREGSFNFVGVKSPAVDAMIQALLSAGTRTELAAAARALDRVLLSGFYVVPLYHLPETWLSFRSTLARPQQVPLFGTTVELWWRENH